MCIFELFARRPRLKSHVKQINRILRQKNPVPEVAGRRGDEATVLCLSARTVAHAGRRGGGGGSLLSVECFFGHYINCNAGRTPSWRYRFFGQFIS